MLLRLFGLTLVLAAVGPAQTSLADPALNPAAALPQSPPFVNCPAGASLGALDLRVRESGEPLPFHTINHLSEGDTLLYTPVLRGKEKRPGDIALVLVPRKRGPGSPDIIVTEPKSAGKPQEWNMKETISIAALVYGPAGLSQKKVAGFLAQDEVLMAQLADYADKTAQAEQLVATLSNSESSSARVNAALSGFASEYGFAVQVDRSARPEVQAATVFAAMNPQLAVYNPLASTTAQSAGQTAAMATMAATLFFGSPVGLAAGGTAMLLNLRSIAFPDTQFRASFIQPFQGSGINLCGQQGPVPPHTRVAYIWASRISNISTPEIKIGDANFIPAGQKTPVPVDVPAPAWQYVDRVRQWALVNEQNKTIPIPVAKLGNQKALEIDLSKSHLAPGNYRLTGFWDWAGLQANGTLHIAALDDFKKAHLEPVSQDRLLAGSGKAAVTVAGSDFEFTTKVELQKRNDEFATAASVPFRLRKGLRLGTQDRMDVQIDTTDLVPAEYELLITQQDGKSHPVSFKILPNPPKIQNLPIFINRGAGTQHFVLKGERLDLLTKLEASGAVLKLNPVDAAATERSLTVELTSPHPPGASVDVDAYLQDRSEPVALSDALQITGPLPLIASSKLSRPTGMAITLRPDEFPAGLTLNAMLDVKNIERTSTVLLSCSDGVGDHASLKLGEQTPRWNLQQLSPDQLFLAFDTSGIPAGCSLQAVINNGHEGHSQPFTLAHIVSIPHVDSFTVSPDQSEKDQPQNGARQYQLTGTNLEMIAKLGWDETNNVVVSDLPAPLPGPGLKQSIGISLPDPVASQGTLVVWLRGDKQGRSTTIQAPPLPAPPPPVTDAIPAPPPAVTDAVPPETPGATPAATPANTPAAPQTPVAPPPGTSPAQPPASGSQ
jgi:hypothetical protein